MAGGHVHARSQIRLVDQRLVHAERLEKVFAHVVGIALSRHFLDHQGGHREQDVVVGIMAAETVLQRHPRQPLDHVPRGVAGRRPVQQIARAQTQPAAMRQQVANAHLVRHIRVGHAEPGQVVDHPVVHLQLAGLGQLLQRSSGERLGVGSDREQGMCVNLAGPAEFAQSETLFQHHLAIPDDGHRDTRHLEGAAGAVDIRAEILQLRRQQRPHDVAGGHRWRQALWCLGSCTTGHYQCGEADREERRTVTLNKALPGHRELRSRLMAPTIAAKSRRCQR